MLQDVYNDSIQLRRKNMVAHHENPGSPQLDAAAQAAEAARHVELLADRDLVATPLPGAGQTHYTDGLQRQAALDGAERANVAREAGYLDLTSTEWYKLRADLGRPPNRGDVPKS